MTLTNPSASLGLGTPIPKRRVWDSATVHNAELNLRGPTHGSGNPALASLCAAQKVRSFSAAVTGAEGHLGTLLLGPESQVHRPRYVTVST